MFRLRRAAMTLTLGVAAVGGLVVGAAGVAGADTLNGGTIAAASAPTIASTGTNQAAGTLTITIPAGSSVTAGDTVNLELSDSGTITGNGTVCWAAAPSVSSSGISVTAGPTPSTVGTACAGGGVGDTEKITVGADTGAAAATITISNIAYDTASAVGTLGVYTSLNTSAPALVGDFAPYPVSNGTLPAAPPTNPTLAVTAATTPTIGAGLSAQAGGNWAVTLGGSSTAQGWVSGYQVALEVADNGGTNCVGNDFVLFSSLPSITVSTTNFGSTAAPTVTPVLAYTSPCGPSQSNTLLLQFTNSGTLPAANATFTITVTGVQYSTGTTTTAGNIAVTYDYETGGATPTVLVGPTTSKVAATAGASDASVATVVVQGNIPAVSVNPGALNAPISPLTITESQAGKVVPGYVCVTLTGVGTTGPSTAAAGAAGSAAFNPATVPTIAVTSGNATVASTPVAFETTTGGTTDNTVVFDVTGASSGTSPSTFTLSNLGVNAGITTTGAVTAMVSDGIGGPTLCPSMVTTTTATVGSATAFTVSTAVTQIFGPDADSTAAAELAQEFPPGVACPGNFAAGAFGPGGNSAVVLATDANYPDALAGAYLARDLGTGELLTPTGSLSTVTLNAIRTEGINQVYVVGGPLAISNADIAQLKSTPAYYCGGNTQAQSLLGSAVDLTVTQIYGQTEYDTAQDIAEQVATTYVGSASVYGAYSGTNSSSGNGMYNDTSGNGSTAPSTTAPLRTAILATGQGFQDAMAASSLAYAERFPILLTTPSALSTQAQTTIQTLGIQQVIVMGGPVAVANAVVTSLQGLGVSVLRIAGQDYTDTAGMLANFEVNAVAGGLGLGWNPNAKVSVARGDFYTDGLAGAVVEAYGGTPFAAAGQPAQGAKNDPIPAASEEGGGTGICVIGGAPGDNECATPLLETISPSSLGTYLPVFLATAGSATGIDALAGTTAGDKITGFVVLGGPLAVTPSQITTMQGDL